LGSARTAGRRGCIPRTDRPRAPPCRSRPRCVQRLSGPSPAARRTVRAGPPDLADIVPVVTPHMLEGGFNPQADVFNRLLKGRVVMLGAAVDDEIANQLCAQLLYLDAEDDNKDIWLYINSPGGSVTAGMAIYDTMQ